jgi:hypothetical protein
MASILHSLILIFHILIIIILTIDFKDTNTYNINDYLQICSHITHNNGILIILIRDFSLKLYVLPDDDMRCAIETCRSSESVLV